jgi:hypothetical protein
MGGSVGSYAKSYKGEIESQMIYLLGFSSGVYIDTPDLGLHEDNSESYQLLLIRDPLTLLQVIFLSSRVDHLLGITAQSP